MRSDPRALFARLARNNRWANHRLHRAVGQLRPGEFMAARTNFFPSIAETLNHILSVDIYYLDAIEEGGEGRRVYQSFQPFDDIAPLAAEQDRIDRRLIGFCDRLTDGDLARSVGTDRGEQGFVSEAIPDLLAHIFQHQIHHRGQVHAMLAGTSVKPPQLDEFFLLYDRADDIGEALGEADGQ